MIRIDCCRRLVRTSASNAMPRTIVSATVTHQGSTQPNSLRVVGERSRIISRPPVISSNAVVTKGQQRGRRSLRLRTDSSDVVASSRGSIRCGLGCTRGSPETGEAAGPREARRASYENLLGGIAAAPAEKAPRLGDLALPRVGQVQSKTAAAPYAESLCTRPA